MKLKYGQELIKLNLPSGVRQKVLRGPVGKPLSDPVGSIVEALRNPIDAAPLRNLVNEGERVCLLVNDSTRAAGSELFLPLIIDELLMSGVRAEDIFIQFTNGTHRAMAPDEMRAIVGENVSAAIAMYNHDSRNDRELVSLGRTSYGTPVIINKRVMQADRRILTGSVVHHFFAGFGGGRKALVPGVAGWETINKNHSLMFDQQACSGILQGNPVHEDLLEAAKMAGGDFLLNTVLDSEKNIIEAFAGNMVSAHLAACSMVEKVNGCMISEQADVVIASCGGYPKDINLYQAHKTLDNALTAMKPGGHLILLAQCSDGIGSQLYEEWAGKYSDLSELEAALRKNFMLGAHKAYTVGKLLQKGTVYLVSDLEPEKTCRFGFIPAASLEDALKEVYRHYRNSLTYIIPQGSTLVPRYSASS